MPRSTINDRARKARIRAREYRKLRKQLEKLETITQAQIASLRKVTAAMEKGEPLAPEALPGWEDLREMGTVRLDGDVLILTSVGADVLDAEDES